MYFGVGSPWRCAGAFPRMYGGILVLVGLALSSQTVGSLLRNTVRQSRPEKNVTERV